MASTSSRLVGFTSIQTRTTFFRIKRYQNKRMKLGKGKREIFCFLKIILNDVFVWKRTEFLKCEKFYRIKKKKFNLFAAQKLKTSSLYFFCFFNIILYY